MRLGLLSQRPSFNISVFLFVPVKALPPDLSSPPPGPGQCSKARRHGVRRLLQGRPASRILQTSQCFRRPGVLRLLQQVGICRQAITRIILNRTPVKNEQTQKILLRIDWFSY